MKKIVSLLMCIGILVSISPTVYSAVDDAAFELMQTQDSTIEENLHVAQEIQETQHESECEVMTPDYVAGLETLRTAQDEIWAASIGNVNSSNLRIRYASQILTKSNIVLAKSHPSGVSDDAFAYNNIVDTAEGRQASRSAYGNAPGGKVDLSIDLLRLILDLEAQYGAITISEIAGASHSANSLHYQGVAIDVTRIGSSVSRERGKEIYNFIVSKGYTLKTALSAESYGVYEDSSHYHIAVTGYTEPCSHTNDYWHNTGYCTNCGSWLPNMDDNYGYNPDGSVFVPGQYRVKSGQTAYLRPGHPYQAAEPSSPMTSTAGTVEVLGSVLNGFGNVWYKLNNDFYCYANNLEFVSAQASSITVSGVVVPSGTLEKGKSFGLSGIISSTYTLTNVYGAVLNASGQEAIPAYSKNPNSTTYNIKSGGMDSALTFGKLTNGAYTYVVRATDANGTTKEVIRSSFSVGVTSYTVSYDANGGTGAPSSQTKTAGTALTLSSTTPTRTMYVFKGWATSSSATSAQYQPGGNFTTDANTTLYAVWEKGVYTITYDANGGTGAPSAQTFTYNSGERFSTVVPTREGYTFVNWRDDYAGGYYNPGDAIPAAWGGNTLRAQWQANTYYLDLNGILNDSIIWNTSGIATLDLYINGELALSGDPSYCDYCTALPYGTTYEIRNICPQDGYSFDGFYTGSDYSMKGFTHSGRTGVITQDTSLAPVFHTCPDSISETPKKAVYNGHTYYYFSTPVTWYDAKTICENMGGHLATVTTEGENEFLFSFVENVGFWLGATDYKNEGDWQWVDGEQFAYSNWGSGEPNNESSYLDSSENYLMGWKEDNSMQWNDSPGCVGRPFVCELDSASYTIVFDPNGGKGTMGTMTAEFGEHVTLPKNGFIRPGYRFAGWNLKRSVDERWYVWGIGWLSEKEMEEQGAAKTLYSEDEVMWLGTYDGSDTYTFVSVWSSPDFVLPASLTVIEEESFTGGAFTFVKLPDGVAQIGKRAFADSPNLRAVYIPATATMIAADAFDGATGLTVYGESDSYAEFYAQRHGFPFIPAA